MQDEEKVKRERERERERERGSGGLCVGEKRRQSIFVEGW